MGRSSETADALPDVLLQTFAVEPGLDTVVVAYVEDIENVGKLGAIEAVEYKYLVSWVERGGEGVVKTRRGGVGTPIDWIDTHDIGSAYNGFDVANGRNDVVADGDSCVGGILDGTCPRSLFDIVGGDFVPEYIGGYKALTLGGCQPLEQFDYGFATLAEAREDERTTLVVDAEKMGKSGLDVAEGYGEVAVCDGVFVECSPGVEGDVAIMGGRYADEAVRIWAKKSLEWARVAHSREDDLLGVKCLLLRSSGLGSSCGDAELLHYLVGHVGAESFIDYDAGSL